MSDDKKRVGNPDRQRISLEEEYEIQDWSKKFGVSKEELKQAVQKVGSNAKDVEEFLKKKR
jgi:hypothetical protein